MSETHRELRADDRRRDRARLRHSPVPAEIVPQRLAGDVGLGAGWEMGLISLESFLAGTRPEGRAVDAMANASPEELAMFGEMATEISDAWTAVIAAER
jgi:hypothetical protein